MSVRGATTQATAIVVAACIISTGCVGAGVGLQYRHSGEIANPVIYSVADKVETRSVAVLKEVGDPDRVERDGNRATFYYDRLQLIGVGFGAFGAFILPYGPIVYLPVGRSKLALTFSSGTLESADVVTGRVYGLAWAYDLTVREATVVVGQEPLSIIVAPGFVVRSAEQQ